MPYFTFTYSHLLSTQVDVMPGLLEVVEEDDNEQEDDYSKQRHEARKRQLAAKTSPVQVRGGAGSGGAGNAICTRCASASCPPSPALRR